MRRPAGAILRFCDSKTLERRIQEKRLETVKIPPVQSTGCYEIAMEDALHEINEILERKDINDNHKAMILGENAKRFYNS